MLSLAKSRPLAVVPMAMWQVSAALQPSAAAMARFPSMYKMEVMQRVWPEVWNPVTSASKAPMDLDSAMGVGFDRWPGSPVETKLATGLA